MSLLPAPPARPHAARHQADCLCQTPNQEKGLATPTSSSSFSSSSVASSSSSLSSASSRQHESVETHGHRHKYLLLQPLLGSCADLLGLFLQLLSLFFDGVSLLRQLRSVNTEETSCCVYSVQLEQLPVRDDPHRRHEGETANLRPLSPPVGTLAEQKDAGRLHDAPLQRRSERALLSRLPVPCRDVLHALLWQSHGSAPRPPG